MVQFSNRLLKTLGIKFSQFSVVCKWDSPSTARPTSVVQNSVNQIGDNTANKPQSTFIGVARLDIMLHLASTKTQFVTIVAK